MIDDNELASRLVWQRHLSVKHLQLALEWQRQEGGSVIELLLQMRAVTEDVVEKTRRELAEGGAAHPPPGNGTGTHERVEQATAETKSFARGSLYGYVAPTLSDDRRSFRRTKLTPDWSIIIGPYSSDDDLEVLNLSMGGLAFRIGAEPPEMGALFDVTMSSPRGHALSVTGQVCHVALSAGSRYSIGIEFVEPTAAAIMVLDTIVREYSGASK